MYNLHNIAFCKVLIIYAVTGIFERIMQDFSDFDSSREIEF